MIFDQSQQHIDSLSPITGVSLGPGDPDLITVQGLKALQDADVIYYPGSLYKSGNKASYSLSILEHYQLDTDKLKGFYLEMSLAREQAEQIYESTYHDIKADYERGLKVAIVSEGDLSTYSSFSYLLIKMKAEGLDTRLIPGISSFALLAARSQTPLCLQNDRVVILPRVQTAEELQEAIASFDTVILMKIKTVIAVIDQVLSTDSYTVQYGERLGTSNEYVSSDWKEIKAREIPYFSLMIIQK